MTTLRLDQIRIDGGTQPRTSIDETHVSEMGEALKTGARVPAVDVFFDSAEYWLADGFHRYHAHRQVECPEIFVVVHQGTRRDAVLFSVGANQHHGLKRTNEDKRKSALTLLQDEEWSRWSNHEIAKRCGVSDVFVGDIRRGFRTRSAGSGKSSLQTDCSERAYITKHGTEATMNVQRIGPRVSLEKVNAVVAMLKAGNAITLIAQTLKVSSVTIQKIRVAHSLKHPNVDRSRTASRARRDQMREMASDGYTSRQIASALGLSESGCRDTLRTEGIDVPADKTLRNMRRHNATRIIEQMVMDAENLTADVNLIDFTDVNPSRLVEWIASFTASRKALDTFIRQLVKEQEKHGEAA